MKWTIETDTMEIQVFPDLKTLSRAAADIFARLARKSAAMNTNRFTVALSGGSTPKSLYERLASEDESYRDSVEWNRVNFFWSDERCVAPDISESNFKTAFDHLLRPLGISPMNYHRLKGELEPLVAAEEYERLLRLFFNLAENVVPQFDLVLLGMGADGHTASLFPGSEALTATKKIVAAPFVKKFGAHRLTLTPDAIKNAANVVFLIAGADKAKAFRETVEGEFEPEVYPSQLVRFAKGKVLFLVDEAAAQLISPKTIKANGSEIQNQKVTGL